MGVARLQMHTDSIIQSQLRLLTNFGQFGALVKRVAGNIYISGFGF